MTRYADYWLRRVNPGFDVPMANRIGRVTKVFDWDSDEGRYILSEREKSGKWSKLDPREFKFVLTLYYPELIKDGVHGISVEEVLPRMCPGTKHAIFELVPEWMQKELASMVSVDRTFSVYPKEVGGVS